MSVNKLTENKWTENVSFKRTDKHAILVSMNPVVIYNDFRKMLPVENYDSKSLVEQVRKWRDSGLSYLSE